MGSIDPMQNEKRLGAINLKTRLVGPCLLVLEIWPLCNQRLNTGMAPTCDWMIKIVRVITYILTPCSWVWLTACLEWNINVRTPMSQSRNGYLHNQEKAESSLFSEVVQRYSGDEKVICWLNSFSQFRRTIRDWSHSFISPLTGIAPTQTFINIFSIIFW